MSSGLVVTLWRRGCNLEPKIGASAPKLSEDEDERASDSVDSQSRQALARAEIRAGRHTNRDHGALARGHLQANLVILPADWADEFAAFCAANPKPCPFDRARRGPAIRPLPTLGADIDVRSDLPRYRVFRDGTAVSEETDITALWR